LRRRQQCCQYNHVSPIFPTARSELRRYGEVPVNQAIGAILSQYCRWRRSRFGRRDAGRAPGWRARTAHQY
jgi:hypothetical protein